MHLSAILVTGEPSPTATDGRSVPGTRAGSLAGIEVLGQSILERTVERLRQAGVHTTVIADPGFAPLRRGRGVEVAVARKAGGRWAAAMKALSKYAAQGAGPTLIAELGAYVETDFARAVEFHIGKGRPITRFHDDHGPLAYWIVDAARVASEARLSVPLREALEIATPYGLEGYVNRMADSHDLRQLVIDAFLGRCTITPRGREIRPGVWIDEGVRLHKAARLVAPVYVGRNTRVEPAAVITRFSNLERECQVGEGSVVAHASVLAHTAIGRGLEVANAVVDGGEFVDLRRNIAVKIDDPNLIGEASGRMRAASQRRQSEEPGQRIPMPEPEYSYLARAAGRLFEAFTFKGEA